MTESNYVHPPSSGELQKLIKTATIETPETLEEAIKSLKDARQNVHFYELELMECAINYIRQGSSRDEVLLRATWMYWNHPEIAAKHIATACGLATTNQLVRELENHNGSVYRYYQTFRCKRCGQNFKVEVKTRTEAQHNKERSQHSWFQCERCKQAEQEARDKEYASRSQREAERKAEMKAMSYRDYLQTPEWKEIQKYALKRAWYRCQLCGSKGITLNVHHKEYPERGTEQPCHLIVLCRECHRRHHGIINDEETN